MCLSPSLSLVPPHPQYSHPLTAPYSHPNPTEGLLELLSSSVAVVGGAGPLRDRGDEAGALRRDFGGLA